MRVLVCVTGQKTCEKLIAQGYAIAKEEDCDLSVLHVAKQGTHFFNNPEEGEALEYLYKASSTYGAEMSVLRADDILDAIVGYARKNEVAVIVLGRATGNGARDFAQELTYRIPEVEIKSVYAEE